MQHIRIHMNLRIIRTINIVNKLTHNFREISRNAELRTPEVSTHWRALYLIAALFWHNIINERTYCGFGMGLLKTGRLPAGQLVDSSIAWVAQTSSHNCMQLEWVSRLNTPWMNTPIVYSTECSLMQIVCRMYFLQPKVCHSLSVNARMNNQDCTSLLTIILPHKAHV